MVYAGPPFWSVPALLAAFRAGTVLSCTLLWAVSAISEFEGHDPLIATFWCCVADPPLCSTSARVAASSFTRIVAAPLLGFAFGTTGRFVNCSFVPTPFGFFLSGKRSGVFSCAGGRSLSTPVPLAWDRGCAFDAAFDLVPSASPFVRFRGIAGGAGGLSTRANTSSRGGGV